MQIAGISSLMEEAQFSSLEKQTLDQEDFLKLLVTQLQNQDPMEPMDNAEFTSQVAQFNQLEEMYSVNKNLGKLDESLIRMNNFFVTSLIGKNAVVEGSHIHLESNDGASIGYQLNNNDVDVQITIYDQAGQPIKSIVNVGMNEGIHEVMWDGKNNMGEQLPLGEYTFEVAALNDSSSFIEILPLMTGKINEIILSETPSVKVDGQNVLLSNIIKIKE